MSDSISNIIQHAYGAQIKWQLEQAVSAFPTWERPVAAPRRNRRRARQKARRA